MTPDTNMVERVARAIVLKRVALKIEAEGFVVPTNPAFYADCTVYDPDRAEARAAIAAMREPTEAMVGAGLDCADGCTDGWTVRAACIAEHLWEEMIDAALVEGPKT